MVEHVLVTGATGFLGSALVRAFVSDGVKVTATARRRPSANSAILRLDVTTTPPCDWPVSSNTVVVHAAGLAHDTAGTTFSSDDYYEVNARGALAAAHAVRLKGARGLILVSSVKAMADLTDDEPWTERSVCFPDSDYGRSKLEGEHLAAAELHSSSPWLAIVRPAPIYGIGGHGNLSRLISLAARKHMPLLPANAGRRSMVHVTDVVRLTRRLAEGTTDGVFIADDGHEYSARSIQDSVRAHLGRSGRRLSVPGAAIKLAGSLGGTLRRAGWDFVPFGPADRSRVLGNALYHGERAATELEFEPRTSLWGVLPELVDQAVALAGPTVWSGSPDAREPLSEPI